VETVELEGESGETVFGKDEHVVLVDGVGRHFDLVAVALLRVEGPDAEPLVGNDAASTSATAHCRSP
jgi:hypothetical protein